MKPPPFLNLEPPELRAGIGCDSHRLAAGRKLVLGGVEIPSEAGLVGHSDADVLLHAITDAMLGAMAKGDIGTLFPPSDPQWKNAASKVFVQHVTELLESYGWKVLNVDAVVLLERPRLAPHRDRIRASIARIMGISEDAIGLKAKTGEGVGPVGEGLLAEAHAVVLISRSAKPTVM